MTGTVKEIIIDWLRQQAYGFTFAYHNLEEARRHGELMFNKLHNMGTIDRGFRLLQNDRKFLSKYGIRLTQIKSEKGFDEWRIDRL